MQLFNLLLLVISRAFVINSSLAWIASSIELIFELVSLVLNFIHLSFLCKNFIAKGQRVVHSLASVKTAAWVLVFYLVDHESTVIANCEQEIILVGQFHAHNRSTMGLNFREKFQGEFPDLDRSWMALFSDTGKYCFSVCKDLDLADVVASFTSVLVIDGVPDFAVRACHYRTISRVRDIRDALDRDISLLESKIIIFASGKIRSLKLEIIEVGQTVRARVAEARVILKPINARNFTTVAFALLVCGAIDSVEVEDRRDGSSTCGKEMATVTEPYLIAVLERDLIVVND